MIDDLPHNFLLRGFDDEMTTLRAELVRIDVNLTDIAGRELCENTPLGLWTAIHSARRVLDAIESADEPWNPLDLIEAFREVMHNVELAHSALELDPDDRGVIEAMPLIEQARLVGRKALHLAPKHIVLTS